jgi:hypothetical protein
VSKTADTVGMTLTGNRIRVALIAMAGAIILGVGIAGGSVFGIVCGAVVLATVPFTWRRTRTSD